MDLHALRKYGEMRNGRLHASSISMVGERPYQLDFMARMSYFEMMGSDLIRRNAITSIDNDHEEETVGMRRFGLQRFASIHTPNRPLRFAVRQVQQRPDYAAISAWLRHCHLSHPRCRSNAAVELHQITLIDTYTQQLVPYRPGAEYAALSYVWGKVEQPVIGRDRILPANVPRTIRQATLVCAALGIQYLWTDSCCIDQTDLEAKQQQINIMDRIYEGAIVTIVALDGVDAQSGLPGVEEQPQRIPQLLASFGPYQLLSRHPRFQDQLEQSPWLTRGWTYQEGVLSSRCLFFTQHQAYFRCTEMFCSEDLHNAEEFGFFKDDTSVRSALYDPVSQGVFRALQNTLLQPAMNHDFSFRIYDSLVSEYIIRQLSHDSDGLNAFSAFINRLERDHFPDSFLCGLPLIDFRRALMWADVPEETKARSQHGRRPQDEGARRRTGGGLPSWSWVGWELDYVMMFDEYTRYEFWLLGSPLRAWTSDKEIQVDLIRQHQGPFEELDRQRLSHLLWTKFDALRWKPIYSVIAGRSLDVSIEILQALAKSACARNDISMTYTPPATASKGYTQLSSLGPPDRIIVMEGLLMTQACYYSDSPALDLFLNDEIIPFKFWASTSVTLKSRSRDYDFLFLTTCVDIYYQAHRKDCLTLTMILIDWQGDVATRAGICRFDMTLDEFLAFWQQANPRIQRFLFA